MQSDKGIQSLKLAIEKPETFRRAVDIVILLTKSFQSKTALSSIATLLTSDTIVLSLQNGLGNDRIICEAVGADKTWLGVTMVPVDRVAPGVVECKGAGDTWFGPLQGPGSAPLSKCSARTPNKVSPSRVGDRTTSVTASAKASSSQLSPPTECRRTDLSASRPNNSPVMQVVKRSTRPARKRTHMLCVPGRHTVPSKSTGHRADRQAGFPRRA